MEVINISVVNVLWLCSDSYLPYPPTRDCETILYSLVFVQCSYTYTYYSFTIIIYWFVLVPGTCSWETSHSNVRFVALGCTGDGE